MDYPYDKQGKVTWIIGDIHGMYDPLQALINRLDSEGVDKFVFVGDYIDHGPSSKQVLDLIIGLGDKAVALLGNHEYLLLQTLFDEHFIDTWGYRIWRENGAQATIRSFGYENFEEFKANIDTKYTDFLKSLPFFHTETVSCRGTDLKFLITHAGIMPSLPLEEQIAINSYPAFNTFLKESQVWIEDSFIWIRDDFLKGDPDTWKDYIIIHGHTPTHLLKHIAVDFQLKYEGETSYCRINPADDRLVSIDVDTSAAFGNRLTAIGLSSGWCDIDDYPGLTIRAAQVEVTKGYYNKRPLSFNVFGIPL